MQYRTVWVKQWVSSSEVVVKCADVDTEIARWVETGWTLHSMTPGTNAQTHSGLFVTFMRD